MKVRKSKDYSTTVLMCMICFIVLVALVIYLSSRTEGKKCRQESYYQFSEEVWTSENEREKNTLSMYTNGRASLKVEPKQGMPVYVMEGAWESSNSVTGTIILARTPDTMHLASPGSGGMKILFTRLGADGKSLSVVMNSSTPETFQRV